MTVSDGERDEPWAMNPDNDSGRPDSPDGNPVEGGDGPVELTDEASRLDLDDDDPPLPWLQGDDDEEDLEGSGIGQTLSLIHI